MQPSSDDIEIVSDEKYMVHSNGSLSILDVQNEDEGAYRIEISNSDGLASEDIEVELIPWKRKFITHFIVL